MWDEVETVSCLDQINVIKKSEENDNLPYAEFSCNNSYQASLKMVPFEALYGRRCRTPLSWDEVGVHQLFGPDLIKESEEKVKLIRDRLKVA